MHKSRWRYICWHDEKNYPNGKGKLSFVNGNVYEGDVVYGIANGKGKLTLKNGIIYKSDISNNVPDGVGKFTFSDGVVYEGKVNNGKPDEGKLTFRDKTTYVGKVESIVKTSDGKIASINETAYENGVRKDNKQDNEKKSPGKRSNK